MTERRRKGERSPAPGDRPAPAGALPEDPLPAAAAAATALRGCSAGMPPQALLALQQTAGNQAIAHVLARAPATAVAAPMPALTAEHRRKLKRIEDRLGQHDLALVGDVFPDEAALARFLDERKDRLDGAIQRIGDMSRKEIAIKQTHAEAQRGGDAAADLGEQNAADAPSTEIELPPEPERRRAPKETKLEPGDAWGKQKGGQWDGAPGNSRWQPDDPVMNELTGGKGIAYRNDEPDLRPFAVGRALIEMTGDNDADFWLADRSLAQQRGWLTKGGKPDEKRAQAFREALQLTWHHVSDGETMLLVSQHIHNPRLPHVGGASAARRGEGEGADLSGATGRNPVPSLAQQVGGALTAKRSALYHQRLEPVQRELAALEGQPALTPEQRERLTALQAKQAELVVAVAALDLDIAALKQPGTPGEVVDEIAARRTQRSTTTTTTGGFEHDPEKLLAGKHERETETVDVSGEETGTRKKTRTHKVDLTELSYEFTDTDRRSQRGPGVDTGRTTDTSVKAGLGAVSVTTGSSSRTGDRQTGESEGFGLERGGGALGYSVTEGASEGRVDADGTMVKGTESSTRRSGSVIANRDAVGGGAATTRDFKQIHAKGVETGVTTSADGRLTLSVKRVEGPGPPRYDLVLTVSLSAGVGGKASAGRKGADSEGSAKASLEASGSAVVSFRHRLAEPEAERYLASLGVAAGGEASGSDPELAMVATAVRNGREASQGLVPDVMAAFGSVEGARQMREGDAIEYRLAGKVSGKAGIEAKGGAEGGFGLGAGLKGGMSAGGARSMRLAKEGGKLVVTKELATESGWSAGGSLSAGAGKMAVDHEQGSTAARSVTFRLDPENEKAFAEQFAAIERASTQEDMLRLVKRWPEVVDQTAKLGQTAGSTTGLGAGPATLEITEKTAYEQSKTTSGKGETHAYAGSSTLGAGVKIGPLPKVGASTEEKASARVTYTKTPGSEELRLADVSGDVSTTRTDTSLSLKELGEKLEKDRIGLLTEGAKLTEDTVYVSGIKLTRADFEDIVAKAHDRSGWMRACPRLPLRGDWEAVAEYITGADDLRAVGEALSAFTSEGGYDRVGTVQRMLRAPGKAATAGIRYEFPPALAAHKATFEELVVGNPLAQPRALAAEGRIRQALEETRRIAARLRAFAAALQATRMSSVAARGEMLRRTSERHGQLAELEQALSAQLGGGATAAPDHAATAEYDRLLQLCQGFKADERATFEAMAATYWGTSWFSDERYPKRPGTREQIANAARMQNLLELYAQWKPVVARLHELAAQLGRPLKDADLAPDEARYDRHRREGSVQTATGRAPD